jgi:protein-L-isoaspartate O-methyltransferase
VRARANLAPHPNVEIVEGDGALVSFGEADVIYVNAGCTRPAESWLDRLADCGRLILPLTSDRGFDAKFARGTAECWRCLSHRASRSRLFRDLDFAGCDLPVRRKP